MNQASRFSFTPLLWLVALASCGARDQANEAGNTATAMDKVARIAIASDAFGNGQPIPPKFTCDGANDIPVVHWAQAPSGTKSFAFVVLDPDSPGGTFGHWGVFDIPAPARSIGGQRSGSEVHNDFGKPGYAGPCPPRGSGPHHYHFKLFALNSDKLELSTSAKPADVEKAARKHAIAEGELIGTYERR